MELNDNQYWERLEKVIIWSGMCTNRFAKYIGFPRSETLYRVQRGQSKLSRNLAEKVVSKFPAISYSWLLTGAGEMLHSLYDEKKQIRYYDIDVESNIRNIESLEPDTKIILPRCVESDFAMVYRGSAMADVIPTNSMVVLKEISTEQIIYGKEYVVLTPNFVLLRIIRRSAEPNTLKLVAGDYESFDDQIVQTSTIEKIYSVTAKLIINY